jgi:hypothetical protein
MKLQDVIDNVNEVRSYRTQSFKSLTDVPRDMFSKLEIVCSVKDKSEGLIVKVIEDNTYYCLQPLPKLEDNYYLIGSMDHSFRESSSTGIELDYAYHILVPLDTPKEIVSEMRKAVASHSTMKDFKKFFSSVKGIQCVQSTNIVAKSNLNKYELLVK